jgi:hypothetical protein
VRNKRWSFPFIMDSELCLALSQELQAVRSQSSRYDIVKAYASSVTRETLIPFVSFVFNWFNSDFYRYNVLKSVVKQVESISSGEASILGQSLQSDAFRYDFARFLYRLPTQVEKAGLGPILLTLFRSDAYRADWLKFVRSAAPVSGEGDERPPMRARTDTDLLPPEDPSKEQVVDDDGLACCLCQAMRVTMSLFPCGHTKTCYACLKKCFETKRACPTCRADVQEVKRVFV